MDKGSRDADRVRIPDCHAIPNRIQTHRIEKTVSEKPRIGSTGGSGAVRQPALVGELVIVNPVSEMIGEFEDKATGVKRETRQLKADVVVLTGLNAGDHPGMFLSGKPVVDEGVRIVESKENTVMAGRLIRKPLKNYRKYWDTPADLEEAIADPKVVVPNNAYTWLIPAPSEDDLKLIDAYYENGRKTPERQLDPTPFG